MIVLGDLKDNDVFHHLTLILINRLTLLLVRSVANLSKQKMRRKSVMMVMVRMRMATWSYNIS